MERITNYVAGVQELTAQFQKSEQFLQELLSFSRNLESSFTSTSSLFPTLEHLVGPLRSSMPAISAQLSAIKNKLEEIKGSQSQTSFEKLEKTDVEIKQDVDVDWEFVQVEDSSEDESECGSYTLRPIITPKVQIIAQRKPKKKASQGKSRQEVGPHHSSKTVKKLAEQGQGEDQSCTDLRIRPLQIQVMKAMNRTVPFEAMNRESVDMKSERNGHSSAMREKVAGYLAARLEKYKEERTACGKKFGC